MGNALAECAHCALPAPPRQGGGPSFCCAGCESVFRLLHDEELADYYSLAASLGEVPPTEADDRSQVTGLDYAYLDDEKVQARIGDKAGEARLQLTGLRCAACVWLVEKLPARVPGLESARVSLARGHVDLTWAPELISLSEVAVWLDRLGYRVHAAEQAARRDAQRARRAQLVRLAICGACAGNVMLISFGLHAGRLQGIDASWARLFELSAMLISLPVVTYGAWPFFTGVLASLRLRRLHLDLPISLAIVSSYLFSVLSTFGFGGGAIGSYYDSVTALVFLLLIGRWLQDRTQRWALSRWDLLQQLLPRSARVERATGEQLLVASESLQVGDRVVVGAGERLPCDGRIVVGEGGIDAALLTGESQPIPVRLGESYFAGTCLSSGEIIMIADQVGAETRVARLASAINGAGSRRSVLLRRVDAMSGAFSAATLFVALAAAVGWTLVAPERAFDVVTAVLVVSCPCALGLATPVALHVARARALLRGFSIADDASLERLAQVRTFIFDKTGTLTQGDTRVVTHSPGLAKYRAQVAALEAGVPHPMATALRDWAGAPEGELGSQETHMGKGVQGNWTAQPSAGATGSGPTSTPQRIRVGSPAWLGVSHNPSLTQELATLLDTGLSPVAVEVDGVLRGLFGVGDALRDDAKPTIDGLRALGLDVQIASGDHPHIANKVGAALGAKASGGLSPQEKIDLSVKLAPAAMVGDGINDAAAMRAAEVGIAVSRAADIASSVADIHMLQAEGLQHLPELVRGARDTMKLIRRNLGISLLYNASLGALAVAGKIDPLVAAIAMPVSSLSVIALSALGGGFRGEKGATEAQKLHPSDAIFAGTSSMHRAVKL